MAASVAVFVKTLPDGREYITLQDATDSPYVMAFVKRFPDYWLWADDRDCWVRDPRQKKE